MVQKTVTIAKLMAIAPPGTIDPSSTVYNTTMYLMAGLLVLALGANLLVKPVDAKHHLDAGSRNVSPNRAARRGARS
jgi:hypothetical protein